MKKLLSLALAAALALSLTACGGGGDDKSSGSSSSKSGDNSAVSSSSNSQGDASEPQEEEREVPGTYENVSLFLTSTIQVSENGSTGQNPMKRAPIQSEMTAPSSWWRKGWATAIFSPPTATTITVPI